MVANLVGVADSTHLCTVLVASSGTVSGCLVAAGACIEVAGTEVLLVNGSAISFRFIECGLIVETSLDGQTFEGLQACIPSGIETRIVIGTSSSQHVCKQVGSGRSVHCNAVTTVVFRSHGRSILEHVCKAGITRFAVFERGIRLCAERQEFVDFGFHVHTSFISLQTCVLKHTGIVHISERKQIGGFVTTSGDGHIVLMHGVRTEQLFYPLCAGVCQEVWHAVWIVYAIRIGCRLLQAFAPFVYSRLGIFGAGLIVAVGTPAVGHFHIFSIVVLEMESLAAHL